jgi:nucleoside-diphosphate-sugar epimerase
LVGADAFAGACSRNRQLALLAGSAAAFVMRVLVTGATGFVGRSLCEALARAGHDVRIALRRDHPVTGRIFEKALVGEIDDHTDWTRALVGVDAVVHLAGRAHVVRDVRANADLYFKTNERGTDCLARAAAHSGVRRFVYLSSVKVNGEGMPGHRYTASDEPHPQDVYGMSKWLAEKRLLEVAAVSKMDAVIVRSPLVYGPGVRANFLRLLQSVDRERPLPLGAIRNTRSLVSIWNLCDLLVVVLKHRAASGRTWMVSDGEDLSTPDLIRRIAAAMDRRVHLLHVPAALLRVCGTWAGKKADIERLCGSLAVDITQTCCELQWTPPMSVDRALARTVDWYLAHSSE